MTYISEYAVGSVFEPLYRKVHLNMYLLLKLLYFIRGYKS